MTRVFRITDGGATEPMRQIPCKNEDEELQQLLERNAELLPPDQINPDDPPRWVLIKREMPIQSPETGSNQWSIDFLFADQKGMPTFVECKRLADTRARREIVGQMLEYAANGHYYWNAESLREFASQTANRGGTDIESIIQGLQPETEESVDGFFEQVERNLREGKLRLVFFMEQAPTQLKSIVEFLNQQMEQSEVLIVEAKQFETDGVRVVVPALFGFTEHARRVKQPVTVPAGTRRKWSEEEFFQDAQENLDEWEVGAIRQIYEFGVQNRCELKWGTGRKTGSLGIGAAFVDGRTVLTVFSNGYLAFPFATMNTNEVAERLREELAGRLVADVGFSLPPDYKGRWMSFPAPEWVPSVNELIESLQTLFDTMETDSRPAQQ